jgi:hypothetical protein
MAARILVADDSFSTDCLGYPRTVRKGESFREGHPITKAHPGAFSEFEVDNELPGVEQATAAPGAKRTRKKA